MHVSVYRMNLCGAPGQFKNLGGLDAALTQAFQRSKISVRPFPTASKRKLCPRSTQTARSDTGFVPLYKNPPTQSTPQLLHCTKGWVSVRD